MSRGFRLARENVCVGPPTPFFSREYIYKESWIYRYLIVI
jgi:hypothetical protein